MGPEHPRIERLLPIIILVHFSEFRDHEAPHVPHDPILFSLKGIILRPLWDRGGTPPRTPLHTQRFSV